MPAKLTHSFGNLRDISIPKPKASPMASPTSSCTTALWPEPLPTNARNLRRAAGDVANSGTIAMEVQSDQRGGDDP